MPLLLAVAKHADPLAVLGDVHQVEKDAETAGDDPRLWFRERFDPGCEQPLRIEPAGATVPREHPHVLDEGQGLRSGEVPDHRSQKIAEQSNIAPQEVVVGHGAGLPNSGRQGPPDWDGDSSPR